MNNGMIEAINKRIGERINEAVNELTSIVKEQQDKIDALESSLKVWQEIVRKYYAEGRSPVWASEGTGLPNIWNEYWSQKPPTQIETMI